MIPKYKPLKRRHQDCMLAAVCDRPTQATFECRCYRYHKYADLRSLVLRWDNAQTRLEHCCCCYYSLGDGRGGSGGHGIQPMDVDAIGALSWKGKGKDKGKGKGKHDNKGKTKEGKGKQQNKRQRSRKGGWSNQHANKGKNKGKARARIRVKSVFIAGRRAIGRETVSSSRETLRTLSNRLLPQVMINLLQSMMRHPWLHRR